MTNNNTANLYNYEAERDVLSAFIWHENIYSSYRHSISEELFTEEDCKKVFGIMQQMEKEGKQPESTEIASRLSAIGGDISKFMEWSGAYSLTQQRIEFLKDLAAKRKMYAFGAKCMELASNPSTTPEDRHKLIAEITNADKESETPTLTFKETLTALQNGVAERMKGNGETCLRSGLRIIDERHGFHLGDLVIIAGETSQGKSSLATTFARNMASQGVPSVYYSLEMGAEQLAARIVAQDALVTSSRLLYDKLTEEEFKSFYDKTLARQDLPIFFDEQNKTSFLKLCTSIRAMVRKHAIKVAFVDYLQILANSGKNDNREQVIGDMARDLKRLAVEEKVCIVALSQLSRDTTHGEPTIARLRGSGQIEEAADVVLLIHRPNEDDTAKLIIGKNRNGCLGKGVVSFNAELTYFADYEGEAPKPKRPWDNY